MAAAAVYAADRVTPGKTMTQADAVAAGSQVVETSLYRIGDYSQELRAVYQRQP